MKLEEEEKKKQASIKKVVLEEKKLTQKVPSPPKEFKIEVTKLAAHDNKPVDLKKPYIEDKKKQEAKKE